MTIDCPDPSPASRRGAKTSERSAQNASPRLQAGEGPEDPLADALLNGNPPLPLAGEGPGERVRRDTVHDNFKNAPNPSQTWNWQSIWPAPAKLNLFLHVTGRRADGYHLLQTLFCLLDFGDTLRFSPRDDEQVTLATPLPGVLPADDLTVRAARLLLAETGACHGVTIHVEKRIPTGGGLGGGSSDAATTLIALNHLWKLGLPRHRLQTLGLRLGADVPVFVQGRNAFAEGVGEALTPVLLPDAWYLLVKPPVSIPTAAIFTAPDLCRNTPPIHFSDWHPGFGHNDLEPVACRLYPEVADALAWLRANGKNACLCRMSGSGACVFAEFGEAETPKTLLKNLPKNWQGCVARRKEHPLAESKTSSNS